MKQDYYKSYKTLIFQGCKFREGITKNKVVYLSFFWEWVCKANLFWLINIIFYGFNLSKQLLLKLYLVKKLKNGSLLNYKCKICKKIF